MTRARLFRPGIALAALLWTSAATAAKLEIAPERVLEGDAVSIRIVEAPPGSLAAIHAQSVMVSSDGRKVPFYGRGTYRIGAEGSADLSQASSLSGTYVGKDVRGLFWSQERVVPGVTPTLPILVDPKSLVPDEVVLTLQVLGKVEERKTLSFVQSPAGLMREEIRRPDLVGAFYTQRGARKRPVVVILHGSEGGFGYSDWLGPMLVARGYSVFGLVYFSPSTRPVEGVPTALNRIPVELLERARSWLAERPEADVQRFGIVGASKGGEFALVLASIYPWIDAVAAFTPSALVTQGFAYLTGEAGMASSWSRDGRDMPFLPQTNMRSETAKYRVPGGEVYLARIRRRQMAAASPALIAAATIPVERSRAAFFLAGGGDDQTGDSGESVARLARRLKKARYARPVDARVYPEAGHQIVDTGWRPTTTHNSGPSQDGGDAEADAHAQADSWLGMITFLERELKPGASPQGSARGD